MVLFCFKNVVLKLHSQHEGHVDAIFLIYILTINRESLLCQFFSRDIRTHIFCPDMGPKWVHKSPKNSHISLKKCCFFWDEGHLYANYLFYILNIHCK